MKDQGQRAKDAPRSFPTGCEVGQDWWWVYRIQSMRFSLQSYTGVTQNLKRRLIQHNRKGNTSTAPYVPYRLVFCAGFPDKLAAIECESYLKTGSGKAFANKRLWSAI